VDGGQKPLESAMTCKTARNPDNYRLKLWRILTNPTFEVVAAIVTVVLAAWIIVDSEALVRVPHTPVLFAR
jgi:hypothetical protein